MTSDVTPQFPHYDPPQGTPVADRKQAGPLTKAINKMLPKRIKPKLVGRGKVMSDQNVHIKHGKKVKFW